jgi:hypothetical protein
MVVTQYLHGKFPVSVLPVAVESPEEVVAEKRE